MKRELLYCAAMLLVAGSVGARTSTVTATDGGTTSYGVCSGFVIDFNANNGARAAWSPALVSGQQYSVDSISIQLSAANSTTEYLGVYSGNLNYTLGVFNPAPLSSLTFLGASQNAIDFSTATLDTWLTFDFSGINVTADSVTPGTFTGAGSLFFVYQPVNTAVTSVTAVPTVRFNTGLPTITADSLSGIYGNAQWVSQRAPIYMASVTEVAPVPEPSTLALTGCASLAFLLAGRRSKNP